MFNNLSYGDQKQLFLGCLLIWKNKFVKVMSISDRHLYRLWILQDQKEILVENAYLDFTPPYRRIGMVNVHASCVYVMRKPVRQWQVGYSSSNCQIASLPTHYPEGEVTSRALIKDFTSKTIFDALTNKYPSLKEAVNSAELSDGCFAFDKQFAINFERKVFFRNEVVGALPKNRVGPQSIKWSQEKQYLSLLLENNHEKDLRTVATKI